MMSTSSTPDIAVGDRIAFNAQGHDRTGTVRCVGEQQCFVQLDDTDTKTETIVPLDADIRLIEHAPKPSDIKIASPWSVLYLDVDTGDWFAKGAHASGSEAWRASRQNDLRTTRRLAMGAVRLAPATEGDKAAVDWWGRSEQRVRDALNETLRRTQQLVPHIT